MSRPDRADSLSSLATSDDPASFAHRLSEADIKRDAHHIPLLPERLFLQTLGVDTQTSYSQDMTWVAEHLEQHKMMLAKEYFLDALAGRKLQIFARTKLQRICQTILTHRYYLPFMYLALVFQMGLIFWEDPDNECEDDLGFKIVDWTLVFVYALDFVMTGIVVRFDKIIYKKWTMMQAIMVLGMIYDMTFCKAYFRAGRALILISKSKQLRTTVTSMLQSIPKVYEVVALFVVFITFYALVGEAFFHDLYKDLDTEFSDTFSSFRRAVLAMFVFSTTENFPQVMYPALDRAESQIGVGLFFASFVMIVIYIILALLLAALYDNWKERHAHLQLTARVRRYHALLACYHVLLDDGTKKLDLSKWRQLVNAVKPGVSDYEARWMFAFLDRDNDGEINLREFLLGAAHAVEFDFSELRREQAEKEMQNSFWVLSQTTRDFFIRIVRRRQFHRFIQACAFIHTVAMVTSNYPLNLGAKVVVSIILGIFVAEQIVRLIAYPLFKFWRPIKLFDLASVVTGVICEWILPLCGLEFTSIMFFTRAIRVLRILSLSRRLRKMFETLSTVKDIIKMFFISFFLIIYCAACLGVVIFRHNLPSDYDSNIATGDDDDSDDPDVLDPKVKFNSFKQGVIAIFQIAVSNNWQDIMYPHIIDGKLGFYGCIFFVVFFILIIWFGTNIMTALIIDAYVQAKQKAPAPQPQRKVSILGVGPKIFDDVHGDELDMYRSNAQSNPVTPFLQARLPGGLQRSACNRCTDCAVFIAKIESKQICHCGHGKMYHFQGQSTDSSQPGSGTSGPTAPIQVPSGPGSSRSALDTASFGSPSVVGSANVSESLIERFRRFKEQQHETGTDDGRLNQPLLRDTQSVMTDAQSAPAATGPSPALEEDDRLWVHQRNANRSDDNFVMQGWREHVQRQRRENTPYHIEESADLLSPEVLAMLKSEVLRTRTELQRHQEDFATSFRQRLARNALEEDDENYEADS